MLVRKKLKPKLTIVALMALIACCALHIYYKKPTFLETAVSYIIWPALIIQNKCITPLKNFMHNRTTIEALQNKFSLLEKEYQSALSKVIELQALINFDQDSREIIDFKKQYDTDNAALAQVLIKQFSNEGHFFLIDKGSVAGIKKDMVAIFKNCLLGKITDVYPYYSKVILISDKSCKVATYCVNSKATGIYQGCNEEWCASLNHVSHLAHLEIDELIISSGDGLIFPRGFAVGKIKSFKTAGLYHQVQIEPLVDLHAINYCYVIQKGS